MLTFLISISFTNIFISLLIEILCLHIFHSFIFACWMMNDVYINLLNSRSDTRKSFWDWRENCCWCNKFKSNTYKIETGKNNASINIGNEKAICWDELWKKYRWRRCLWCQRYRNRTTRFLSFCFQGFQIFCYFTKHLLFFMSFFLK